MKEVATRDLIKWIDNHLEPLAFKDYAPNGLQVQGKATVRKILLGVTASLALIEKAIAIEADAVIVHHGWFWRNEDARVIGAKYQRMAQLIKHDINLIAYHLPLDAHPEWGNNAQLGHQLGFEPLEDEGGLKTTGSNGLVWLGRPSKKLCLADLCVVIEQRLNRKPLCIGSLSKEIRKVAWCTGGAQSFFPEAIDAGVDVYITGEASEQNAHQAYESGVAFIAAGHHATERYGIQALGQAIQNYWGLEVHYYELDNPI